MSCASSTQQHSWVHIRSWSRATLCQTLAVTPDVSHSNGARVIRSSHSQSRVRCSRPRRRPACPVRALEDAGRRASRPRKNGQNTRDRCRSTVGDGKYNVGAGCGMRHRMRACGDRATTLRTPHGSRTRRVAPVGSHRTRLFGGRLTSARLPI